MYECADKSSQMHKFILLNPNIISRSLLLCLFLSLLSLSLSCIYIYTYAHINIYTFKYTFKYLHIHVNICRCQESHGKPHREQGPDGHEAVLLNLLLPTLPCSRIIHAGKDSDTISLDSETMNTVLLAVALIFAFRIETDGFACGRVSSA